MQHTLTGVDISVDYETLQIKISPKVEDREHPRHLRKGRILFLFHSEDCVFLGVNAMILVSQKSRNAVIKPVDAAGNEAQVENVVWSTSDSNLLTVTPSTDGLSATFTAVGPIGNAQLTVTADAHIGEGVTEISGVLDVQIVAGEAVTLQINVLPEEPVA